MSNIDGLWRISNRYFVAGLEFASGRVSRAAPIIAFMRNWRLGDVENYCIYRKWNIRPLRDGESNDPQAEVDLM